MKCVRVTWCEVVKVGMTGGGLQVLYARDIGW